MPGRHCTQRYTLVLNCVPTIETNLNKTHHLGRHGSKDNRDAENRDCNVPVGLTPDGPAMCDTRASLRQNCFRDTVVVPHYVMPKARCIVLYRVFVI